MKNLTIRGRIILSFAVVILAMIAMGTVAVVELVRIDDQAIKMRAVSLPELAVSSR